MSEPHHRPPPTVRAIRAAISAALGVPLWRLFYVARVLPLRGVPPQRAVALILLALLCKSLPLRGESDEHEPLLQRVRDAAKWKPRRQPVRGSLPTPFKFLELDVSLCSALEILIEQTWTEAVRRHIQDPSTNIIAPNSIEFGLHARRATLSLRLVSGVEWHGVFAPPEMPDIPAERLALRVSLTAPAIVELGRLCFGDGIAERRIGVFANARPMIAEPLTPALAPQPVAQPEQPRFVPRGRRRRATDPPRRDEQ